MTMTFRSEEGSTGEAGGSLDGYARRAAEAAVRALRRRAHALRSLAAPGATVLELARDWSAIAADLEREGAPI